MKINKHNYEEFLVDFMDGTLDPNMRQELFIFLDAHPDIKAEFEGLEVANLTDEENIVFEDKNALKKNIASPTININEDNAGKFFIAAAENDLSASETAELNEFIKQNPEQEKHFRLYKNTKVEADLSITYAHKKALKKHPFVIQKGWYYAAASAAAILLLYLGISFMNTEKPAGQNTLADQPKEVLTKMNQQLTAKKIASIQNTEIVIAKRTITKVNFEHYQQRLLAKKTGIKKLNYTLNPNIQIASSYKQTSFPTKFPLMDFEPIIIEPNSLLLADAGEAHKDSKFKAVWKGLFSQMKSETRTSERGIEDKPKKKVGPLWVLANIGLQRVNEVTGTNLVINNKSNEEKIAEENRSTEYIAGKPAN